MVDIIMTPWFWLGLFLFGTLLLGLGSKIKEEPRDG